MGGSILENLSGKKLAGLVIVFLVCQVICFFIGGLFAPQPSNTDSILGSKCIDEKNSSDAWFYIRGSNGTRGNCKSIDLYTYSTDEHQKYDNQIVFVYQIPSAKSGIVLDYSRWQQNLIGILHVDILYHNEHEMDNVTTITLDAKLGYRNIGDPDDDWKLYAASVEQRSLECSIGKKAEGYMYNCSIIPLFELGSLHHDFYLLNIRLPVDYEKKINVGLGHIADLWLYAINQTGGFTKVWLSLKSVFFPIVLATIIWFWKRISNLHRPRMLLENMLLVLGSALTILNLPLEFLTLKFELPFMLLLTDIRQGLFYAALLSFWLVFSAEHMMENSQSTFHDYWKYLSAVGVGCIAMFVFDVCERGVQLRNPFYTIWVTETGTKVAMGFLVVGMLSVLAYFLLLCWLIWQVFRNISTKKSSLPAMSQARRLYYTGVIYRFKFLLLATLICAVLTLVAFTVGQLSEGHWKWDNNQSLEYMSAFFTGVYGMWNIYIVALIVLYAPSAKATSNPNDDAHLTSEIEFSYIDPEPSEASSLTSFAKKAAIE